MTGTAGPLAPTGIAQFGTDTRGATPPAGRWEEARPSQVETPLEQTGRAQPDPRQMAAQNPPFAQPSWNTAYPAGQGATGDGMQTTINAPAGTGGNLGAPPMLAAFDSAMHMDPNARDRADGVRAPEGAARSEGLPVGPTLARTEGAAIVPMQTRAAAFNAPVAFAGALSPEAQDPGRAERSADGLRLDPGLAGSSASPAFDPAPPTAARLAAAPPAPVAEQVSQQLREALASGNARALELTLAPAELGRVRITFSPAEAGLHVVLNAERQDTQELLRRHADLLRADLEAMGFGGIRFDFGQQHDAPQGRPQRFHGSAADALAPPAPTTIARPAPAAHGGGLDLRL